MQMESNAFNLSTQVNNFRIWYDDFGTGAVPIIFLHGYPFDKTMWLEQIDFLKSSNRVIAYDIRGFGKSTDEVSVFSIDLFVEDLIGFMDSLIIEKAIVCGFSMGGYIALNAIKNHSDRFSALILSDTQCIADTAEIKIKRYQAIEDIALVGIKKFIEKFIKSVFHKDSWTTKPQLVDKVQALALTNSQHSITSGLTAIAEREETCSSLVEVDVPTLIICGREDTVTPVVQSEFMNQKIKGSELHIIENAGHVTNLEQASEFNKHLHNFLKSFMSKLIGN